MRRAPWRRRGGTMWHDPVKASEISGLPTRVLRELADEGLLATYPERGPGEPRRYREDELLALKEAVSGHPEVSVSLIRNLAAQ
ncbi:MAG: MerR family transcriptional regulator [Actinomadura sp.]